MDLRSLKMFTTSRVKKEHIPAEKYNKAKL